MFSLRLILLVVPALVLASSDDWLLSLLEKRDRVAIPLEDDLSLDLRILAQNTRPQFRRFLRSLNFACQQLSALNSTKNERIKSLFDSNNNFGNSLRNSCGLYLGVRRQYLGAAARFSIGFSIVCRHYKAVRTSNSSRFPLLNSILSEHQDFNNSLHESCKQFRKVRIQMIKTIRLLRNGRIRPSPASAPALTTTPPAATSPTAASEPTSTPEPVNGTFSEEGNNEIKRYLRDLFELL